jgi:ankyrin repeat protein
VKILLFLMTRVLSVNSSADVLSEFRDTLKAGDAVDHHGLTGLHYAALQPNDEKVAWLLANGADAAGTIDSGVSHQ